MRLARWRWRLAIADFFYFPNLATSREVNERSFSRDAKTNTRDACATRAVALLRKVQASSLRSPETFLKRLLWLAHVPCAIFEAGEFFQEGEGNFADRSVALFRDNQFCFTFLLCARFLVFFVNFWTDQQTDQVCVLLDGS